MDDMIHLARTMMTRAYAPYSKFHVGAVVRAEDGSIHGGCNVENVAYPQSLCAEASAIAALVGAGQRRILECVVMGGGPEVISPCGGCRQKLREFGGDEMMVHLCGPDGLHRSVTLGQLLPLSFGEHNLGQGMSGEIARRAPGLRPRVAVVLGSGLGAFADDVRGAAAIPYGELPGFPETGVASHAGRLVLGHVGSTPVAVLQGRAHYYERGRADGMKGAIAALAESGCEALLLTNAAGSLRADMPPGSLMAISDHINFTGVNPLFDETGDSRFVDMVDAYDPALRARLKTAGEVAGVAVHEGVYAWFSGPSFETPAEIRAARVLGADAVGMSTAPETILARHAGLKVAALSLITNYAAGMTSETLSHAHTLALATEAAGGVRRLLRAFLEGYS